MFTQKNECTGKKSKIFFINGYSSDIWNAVNNLLIFLAMLSHLDFIVIKKLAKVFQSPDKYFVR